MAAQLKLLEQKRNRTLAALGTPFPLGKGEKRRLMKRLTEITAEIKALEQEETCPIKD